MLTPKQIKELEQEGFSYLLDLEGDFVQRHTNLRCIKTPAIRDEYVDWYKEKLKFLKSNCPTCLPPVTYLTKDNMYPLAFLTMVLQVIAANNSLAHVEVLLNKAASNATTLKKSLALIDYIFNYKTDCLRDEYGCVGFSLKKEYKSFGNEKLTKLVTKSLIKRSELLEKRNMLVKKQGLALIKDYCNKYLAASKVKEFYSNKNRYVNKTYPLEQLLIDWQHFAFLGVPLDKITVRLKAKAGRIAKSKTADPAKASKQVQMICTELTRLSQENKDLYSATSLVVYGNKLNAMFKSNYLSKKSMFPIWAMETFTLREHNSQSLMHIPDTVIKVLAAEENICTIRCEHLPKALSKIDLELIVKFWDPSLGAFYNNLTTLKDTVCALN